jgi:cobalamin biosynthesis protein CobT
MFEKSANVDEFNVRHAADRLDRLGATVRVLVVLADGMTRGSMGALQKTVQQVEQSGTTVLGIGIGDDTVTRAYHRHAVVDRPDALTAAMVDGVRLALRRSLAMTGVDAWWVRAAANTDPMRRSA